MFILYDLIFLIVAVIYLPVYLFKKKFRRSFVLRLGFLPSDLKLNSPIWIHAVSVGEVMAVKGLLEELRRAYPGQKFVISTVTSTGNKIANSVAQEGDFVTYLPLDFNFIVESVINRINPSLFIIVETEIWPNLISYLHDKRIPVVSVNARISDNSFKGYSVIKFLLKPVLNKINLFCVQTDRDAQRLIRLGVLKTKIQVTGNMKFDAASYAINKPDLGRQPSRKFFVAGSTHSGEEEIILAAFRGLAKEFPALSLIIAPRHPERAEDVDKAVVKHGFNPVRISRLNKPIDGSDNGSCVFILDTVGQLMSYYRLADVVFVGGSLIKKGGHNILEPSSLGKPVLFGPYMFNFRDIAELFLKKKAAKIVHNENELEEGIRLLLSEPSKAEELTLNASRLIMENRGATKKNLERIKTILGKNKT